MTFRNTIMLPVVLLLVALFRNCFGEIVFHRRDHKDQGNYGQRPNIYSVQTYDDALKYLIKYGYLNCSISSEMQNLETSVQRRAVVSNPIKSICTELDIEEALRSLQETFKLTPTGRLDEDTKQTMSKGRCGNSDKEQQVLPPIDDDSSGTGTRGGTTRNRIGRHRKNNGKKGKPKNGTKNGRVTRASARHIDHTLVEGRINDTRRNRVPEVKLHSRMVKRSLIDPEEGVSGNALDRRLDMLRDITDRMRSSEQMSSTRPERGKTRWLTRWVSRTRARRRRRKRRSVLAGFMNQVFEGGPSHGSRTRLVKDENKPVKWRLLANGISGKIPLNDQKAVLELSFRMWSEVIPLKFSENEHQELPSIDIVIAFGRETHWNCDKPFDGNGGELAHSRSAGDIHFDEDENYKKDGTGIDLLKVAVHEVGHVLGLLHNDLQSSIMYPIYVSPKSQEDFELVRGDREAIQQIYGVCKGIFDVVFDWVRRVQDPGSYTPKYIFNTYFFRKNRYWMYENVFNRTRYGDPLYIESQWTGLPAHLDAFTQVVLGSGYDFTIDTYFFKGELYYKYSSEMDKVIDGYPRLISQDFGSAENCNETTPNDVDSVYFNNSDNMLYFFKDEWVWIYDPAEIGRNGCCIAKRRFVDLYPTSNDSDDPEPLTGHISSVYYSYSVHTTYIFSGDIVYEVMTNEPEVSLKRLGPWYNIWYDICEVD